MSTKSSSKNTRRSSKPKKIVSRKTSSPKVTKKSSATKVPKSKKPIAKKSATPKIKKKAMAKTSSSSTRKKTTPIPSRSQVKTKKSAATKSPKKSPSSRARSSATKTSAQTLSKRPKASSKVLPRTASKPSARRSASTSSVEKISAEIRYNAGGVCASLLNGTSKGEKALLTKILKNLGLSVLEQRNLLQLSQGFTIPKLFADSIKEERDRKKVSSFLRSEIDNNTQESLGNRFIKELKMTLAS